MRYEDSLPTIGQTAKRRPRRPAGFDLGLGFVKSCLHCLVYGAFVAAVAAMVSVLVWACLGSSCTRYKVLSN